MNCERFARGLFSNYWKYLINASIADTKYDEMGKKKYENRLFVPNRKNGKSKDTPMYVASITTACYNFALLETCYTTGLFFTPEPSAKNGKRSGFCDAIILNKQKNAIITIEHENNWNLTRMKTNITKLCHPTPFRPSNKVKMKVSCGILVLSSRDISKEATVTRWIKEIKKLTENRAMPQLYTILAYFDKNECLILKMIDKKGKEKHIMKQQF